MRVTPPPREPIVGEPIVVRHSCGQWWFRAGGFHAWDIDGSPITRREFWQTAPPIPIGAIHVGPPWPKGYVEVDNPRAVPYRTEEDDAWLGRTGVEGWDPRKKLAVPVRRVGYSSHRGASYGDGWVFAHEVPGIRLLPIWCSEHTAAVKGAA